MKIKQISGKVREYFKSGFFKGVGIGAGLLATSVFAAAMSMTVFAPGNVLSSAQVNKNFEIAAPKGAIMAFYQAGPGNTAGCPDGWAPADGTNGTPDLRGRFIRGRDDVGTGAGAGGNDPGGARAEGDLQDDAFQGHRHSSSTNVTGDAGGLGFGGSASGGILTITIGDPITDGTNDAPRTANETRPKNMALTYCMRQNGP